MVENVTSFEEYVEFISGFADSPLFYDPHFAYDKDNLFGALSRKDEHVFVVKENGTVKGLFVWLILPEERYLEQIIGFSREECAFEEMLAFLEERYAGCTADFVVSPGNTAIFGALKARGAAIDPEQQRMVSRSVPATAETGKRIEPLSKTREAQYRALHDTNTYWTADRILAAPGSFSVWLAVQEDKVCGYIDVTRGLEENEIYALYAGTDADSVETGTALLREAVARNAPHRLTALVDTDAEEEIRMYTAAGFVRLEGQNSVYATCRL